MTARIRFFGLSLALAGSLFARDEYTRRFDQTVPVHAGQRISLENKFGDVVVSGYAGQNVIVHADIRVSAADANQAKEYADKVQIRIEPSSDVSIRTVYPDTSGSFMGLHWSNVSYSVRYEVTVPENAPLSIRNAFGRVSVTGVKASSEVVNSHGDLVFREGQGSQRLENSFARITIANNSGDVSVENSNGSVDASDIAGALTIHDRFAHLTVARVLKEVTLVNTNGAIEVADCGPSNIRNSFGSVTVQNLHGDLDVNNINGKVEATNIGGSAHLRTTFSSVRSTGVQRDLRIESGNGSVVIEKVGGSAAVKNSFGMVQARNIGGLLTVENANGSVTGTNTRGADVRTSFGAVSLGEVAGPIQVENQNGAVDVASSLRGSCQPIAINTSFSPLRVRLEPDASYRVTASTSFGKIRSDFPLNVSGSIASDDVTGSIGAARCQMRLTNRNGNIEILKIGP